MRMHLENVKSVGLNSQPISSGRKAGSWAQKWEKSGKLGQIVGGKQEFEREFY